VRALHGFNSPDRKLWCGIGAGSAFCANDVLPSYLGRITGAAVSLCQDATTACSQQYESDLPVLEPGQTAEADGYRCVAAAAGITCTVTGTGQGFAITTAGVSAVDPIRASAAAAAAHPRSCAKITVNGGRGFGRNTLLVKVLGPVTCAQAHHVVRAWYRRIAAGKCALGGNFCVLSLPGGWSCSFFAAAEERYTGGAPLGCARRSARVRLYPTKETLTQFLSEDRQVRCSIGAQQASCVAAKGHGATVLSNGTVTLCMAGSCIQPFNTRAPRLLAGQATNIHGFRCTAAATGITCTRSHGPAQGGGFVIDAAGVHTVGGA
jgi:hypothetical protein